MNVPSLKWKQIARCDLAGIVAYIARDNAYAAQILRDEIIGKVNLLPHHPRLYRSGRVPNTREMVVRKNYLVVYTESPEVVTVLRVLHCAMKWP